MKFVCLNCETYMNFEKVEKPGEGSLGVFFGCPSCNAKFSMVTNPGETQMVSSLGVKLGGRTVAAEPFEMTRGTLKDEAQAGAGQMGAYLNEKIQGGQPVAASTATPEKAGEKASGGCPFSAMVAEMGLTGTGKPGNGTAPASSDLTWTADAKEKLDRLPAFVKPMVQSSVVFPNQSSWGTHVNIAAGAVARHAKNPANAVKFLEYLASPQAQDHFANGNNEWPVAKGVSIANPALQAMTGGSFKSETLPIATVGMNQVKVQQMLDRV